jgi:hypothetical protein
MNAPEKGPAVTNDQNPQNDLLTELKNIATAVQNGTLELTNWRSERTRGEVDSSRAPLLLDYQVICELMGRGDPTKPRTFEARRTPSTSSKLSLLTLKQLPSGGAKVAIFIRPNSPAEVVDFLKPYSDGESIELHLREVKDDEPIVRLELRRADNYPIALGPRLGAV